MSQELSLRAAVVTWLARNGPRLGLRETRRSDGDASTLKAHFGLETTRHLISITAWEHPPALDVDALDRQSLEAEIVVAGPCADLDGAISKLDQFARWLEARTV